MKNYYRVLLVLVIFAGGIAAPVNAAEKSAVMKVEAVSDATMNKLIKLQEPAEQHQMLSSLNGPWYYEVKYWAKENAGPQISSGIMTNEMVLGGRFLSSKTSLLLNIGGQNIPYEGWGLLGYDTVKNVFTSVWADRMGQMTGTGTYNKQTKTVAEKGRFTNLLIGKEEDYRSELQFTGDDTYKRTIFIPGASGKEFKIVEIEFSRRK